MPALERGDIMAAADFVVRGDTKLDGSGFSSGLQKLGGLASKGLKILGTATAGTLAGLGAYATKVGSDFEAAMSEVQAISGATGEELQALSEAAQEMGATTKFSAAESADALKYMAMAGWDTQKMLGGLPGVINLAAASGEDLAAVSDIVTDAMTAFGLSADKAAHFADVLAQASNRSNTDVAMLGESFKYVAPVAGALSFSIEDTAVALGLMANSGIKASQAGTSLRALLTNLVRPVGQAEDAIAALDISVRNSDGSMKSLSEIMVDLRSKFSKLTDAEQAQYAAMLAGQEGMSGLLAIINTSDADFASLTASINNADGAAQQMADTMQDNLQGSFANLTSAAEGFGIALYEEVGDNIRHAVDEVTQGIRNITQALQEDGVSGVIKVSKNMLLGAARTISAGMPNAISEIKTALMGSSDTLVDGFLDIAQNIVKALLAFLPKNLQKPFQAAMDGIFKTLKNGGANKILGTLNKTLQNFSKVAGKIAKTVLPIFNKALDIAVEHFDTLLPLAVSLVGALKTYSVVQNVTKWFSAMTSAVQASAAATSAEALATAASTGAITAKQAAVGVLTGKIQLATAAQAIWNSTIAAHPLATVITFVTTLATGIGLLTIAMGDEQTAEERLAESSQALGESFSGVADAASNFQEGLQTAESHLNQFNDELFASSEEQQELADNMQQVQSGITAICQTAAEERRGYTAQEIEQLNQYFDKMREIADAQLAIQEAKSAAIRQQAQTELENFQGNLDEYEVIGQEYLKTAQEQYDAQIALIEEQSVTELTLLNQRYGDEAVLSNGAYKTEYDALMQRKNERIAVAQEEVARVSQTYQDGYLERTENLQGFLEKSKEANTQLEENESQHNQRINDLQAELKAIRESSTLSYGEIAGRTEEIQQQMAQADEDYANKRADIQDGLNQLLDDATEEELGAWLAMLANTEMYGGEISDENRAFVDEFLAAYDSMDDESKAAMDNSMNALLSSMKENEPALFSRASGIAGGILNSFTQVWEIHSPSRAMKRLTRNLLAGGEEGLKKEKPKFLKTAGDIAQDALDEFKVLDAPSMVAQLQSAVSGGVARINNTAAASGSLSGAYSTLAEPEPTNSASVVNNQYIYFEEPMQAPDEIARALRIQQTFGLAGAR